MSDKPRSLDQHRVCETCGEPFPKPHNEHGASWARRRFCSIKCRKPNLKHGSAWKAPEYAIWQAIIQRCTNPNARTWNRYGGRGITICERWRSYVNFITDVGKRPSPTLSLDRIDNMRGYEPGNCRWTDIKTQARNTRLNRRLTVNGQSRPITEWAELFGIKPNTIATRLRSGWSEARAVQEPCNSQFRTRRAHG